MNIQDTNLPIHTRNVLLRRGITTTEELNELTEEDLIKVRGLGKRDFDAIKEMRGMNEVIDVEYKEISQLEDRSTEVLTAEANELWRQMELIGNIGIQLAIQAGQRLNVVKERLPHGAWENWAENHLNFSIRKAKNMMRLATKASDEDSLFSNRQTFADIGISKVYALLSTTEEVAEEVINEPGIDEISVRKLQEKIKLLEKEKAEALTECEETKKEKSTWKEKEAELINEKAAAEIEAARLQKEIDEILEKQLQELQEPEVDEEKIKELEEELTRKEDLIDNAEEKLEKIKEKLKQTESDKKTAIEEAVKEATDSAKKKAKDEIEEEIARWKEKYSQLEKEKDSELEKYQKKLKSNSNTEIVVFKIKSDILQKDFNDCLSAVDTVAIHNPEQAEKMKTALKKVMKELIERI